MNCGWNIKAIENVREKTKTYDIYFDLPSVLNYVPHRYNIINFNNICGSEI